jgi:glycosyltransferase involved in cell wall biosynthesis
MARGNGAYVIHQILANSIPGYHIHGYNPYWTLVPLALPLVCNSDTTPDILHSTPDYAWFFKKKDIPLIITFHNYVLDGFMREYSSLAQRIHYASDLNFFTRKALQHADAVTSVSRFTADMVRRDLGFKGSIRVIYNGIDTDRFYPQQRTARKTIRVLVSGNLTRRKGADLLPRIARRLDRNIEIVYTSGLRTSGKLPNLLNMRHIGSIPYSKMPETYRNADILLFPTVREGFGLAAAEAMACGLPVVATDCSSLPELIVHGKGGFLCGLGNVQEFADRINTLAASPDVRKKMGEYNRARVEQKFTLERMIKEYKELFEKVLSTAGV